MSLNEEVQLARKRVSRDGYDMSLGEIASLYEKRELFIQPEYQRLRVWDETQKTRFIESILLNIPIPPIFVFADESGRWELVDGLQRVSTILEFMGLLVDEDQDTLVDPFVCEGTTLLPSLSGMRWPRDNEEEAADDILPTPLQISFKRGKIRVEILGQESDPYIKYELFQRLNTGGSNLSRQEIRNCVIISINRKAFDSISAMATNQQFLSMVKSSGEERAQRAFLHELVVRFVVYRHYQYRRQLDVHEYLDEAIIDICQRDDFDWDNEVALFGRTMNDIYHSYGEDSFIKNRRFSLAFYEFIVYGTSSAISNDVALTSDNLREKIAAIPDLPEAQRYTGSGIRGTQRLAGFVFAKAPEHFS